MRIAYMVHLNMGRDSGVFKKIVSQVQEWVKIAEVKVFLITRMPLVAESLKEQINCDLALYKYMDGLVGYPSRISTFKKAVTDIIAWDPDVIYTRQDYYYPPVKRLATMKPLIIEINTNDIKEIWKYSKLQCVYHFMTRDFVLSKASGFVFVCSELAELQQYKKYNKPYAVIGNGYPMDGIEPFLPTDTEIIKLVFIGQSGCPWHGVDKIACLAKLCPEWQFELIGISRAELGQDLPVNLHLHGKLGNAQYAQILQSSDCAIGTMALHRKGMTEASPLKVREYLAYGLPVIIGYKDTDFPNGAPFLLELPNCEDNIASNIQLIKNFVHQWKGRRVPREEILHLSAEQKEAKRLAFFRQIAGVNHPGCESPVFSE